VLKGLGSLFWCTLEVTNFISTIGYNSNIISYEHKNFFSSKTYLKILIIMKYNFKLGVLNKNMCSWFVAEQNNWSKNYK